MSKVLIVGAGGVGGVVTHKCAQVPEVFSEIVLASRTLSRCEKIQKQIDRPIAIEQVDADNVAEMVELINVVQPDLVINVALPYQDLPIMDACLETGVDYLDTANYEPPDEAKFEYKWQWAYQDRFRERGIMALLGCGFDPGVTNIFCAYAQKQHFDEIHTVDILDCNARRPRPSVRDQFQSRDQHPRDHRNEEDTGKMASGKRSIRMSISMDFDFPEGAALKTRLSAVSRGAGIASQAHQGPETHPLLDDLRRAIHHALAGAAKRRHDPHRPRRIRGAQDRARCKFLKAVLPDPGIAGRATTPARPVSAVSSTGVKDGKRKSYSSTTSATTPNASRRSRLRPFRTRRASPP